MVYSVIQLMENFSSNHSVFDKLAEKRILFLGEELNAEIATNLAAYLLLLDAISHDEITIYINSPGGEIETGLFPIYDTMQAIKSPVRTVAIGQACSGAAVILCGGTKGSRFAYPNAKIMIHGVQTELSGNSSDIEKESKMIKKLNQSLMEMIAKHSGQKTSKVKRDCKEDKWFGAAEAVKYGLIDGILNPEIAP